MRAKQYLFAVRQPDVAYFNLVYQTCALVLTNHHKREMGNIRGNSLVSRVFSMIKPASGLLHLHGSAASIVGFANIHEVSIRMHKYGLLTGAFDRGLCLFISTLVL